MDRLACLELPAFPLQLVLRAHADWRGEPAAVVERDVPHGLLLWVNHKARAVGVLPGQRYAAALGLCARLRAGVISEDEIQRGVAELVQRLQRFSPEVEPCMGEPGVFWLGARGLERLFGAPREWAGAVLAHVQESGFEAKIAVGFRHFAVYAGVKAIERSPIALFEDMSHEACVAAGVSLARLPIDPEARDALAKLAITNLGEFAKLPAGGILQRFGDRVHRLHRMAAGAFDEELVPTRELIPLAAHMDLELPDGSMDSLLAYAEELTRPLCAALAQNAEATSAITLRLDLDDRTSLEERVIPARPTCDVDWLMRLLRMRLEARVLASGAVRVGVMLVGVPTRAEQATLFLEAKSRSRSAAAKAFSALRARFGEEAVVCARPVSAHLPEHSFTWERCDELPQAAPTSVRIPTLVRCLFEAPLTLPPRGRHEPDGWLLRGVTHGSVAKLLGPYRLSGGWWRSEVKREYYFAELTGGEIAWIFYDLARRRWFLQGTVS